MQISFPAPAMVAHTKRTFLKNNHNRNQTADPGKKLTVMSTCSFIADKKLQILSFFSESSHALKNFFDYVLGLVSGKLKGRVKNIQVCTRQETRSILNKKY